MKETPFRRLFEPTHIDRIRLKNRIVMLPMGTAYASAIGEVTQKTIDHYVERARGGVGFIVVGGTSPFGRKNLNQLVLDADWFMAGHYELVEAIHAEGVPICTQLSHPGRQWYPWVLEGNQPVSASDVRCFFLGEIPYPKPRPLARQEIYEIMDKWAEAAGRAKKVGYDAVELHGGHGYLMQQFMSPYSNKRTDEFGGSLENRMRFPLELIKRVRKLVGDTYPLGFRFPAEEFLEGGITIQDSPAMAKILEDAGIAYLSIACATFETCDKSIDVMRDVEGWKAYLWEGIKKAVKIPVVAAGGLRTPAYCEKVLAEGKADFIGLARPLLADPHWPNKVRESRIDDVCPCISCVECLHGSSRRRQGGGARRCSVNAAAGREAEFTLDSDPGFMQLRTASTRRKVMIVGGGPGGMEAARIAALRGHDVSLYDKGNELGGALLLAGAPPGKAPIETFRRYLKGQVAKAGVRVELRTEVTPELVQQEKPDVVVVATGARPVLPASLSGDNIVDAWDVLSGKVRIANKKVLIVGGGMIAVDVADYLVPHGNAITMAKRQPTFAPDMERLNRHAVLRSLREAGVVMLAGKEVLGAAPGGVLVSDMDSGQKVLMKADVVVLAMGETPDRSLAEALEGKAPEVYTIGDCNQPRVIMEAVYEGSRVARRI